MRPRPRCTLTKTRPSVDIHPSTKPETVGPRPVGRAWLAATTWSWCAPRRRPTSSPCRWSRRPAARAVYERSYVPDAAARPAPSRGARPRHRLGSKAHASSTPRRRRPHCPPHFRRRSRRAVAVGASCRWVRITPCTNPSPWRRSPSASTATMTTPSRSCPCAMRRPLRWRRRFRWLRRLRWHRCSRRRFPSDATTRQAVWGAVMAAAPASPLRPRAAPPAPAPLNPRRLPRRPRLPWRSCRRRS